MNSSVEIKKFSQLANQWWDRDGPLKTLHDINPARIRYIEQNCTLEKAVVLDLGCGGGILSEALARKATKVIGLDLSADAIKIAEQHCMGNMINNLEYCCESAEQHAHTNSGLYDIIVCMELLEHVDDPEKMIQSCSNLLKPHGDLFLSTLHRKPTAYIKAIVIAEHIFKWIPPGTHDYSKFIKPSELSHMCRMNQLEVKSIHGLHYNPFTRHAWINKKTNLNYFLHAKKRD